MIHERFARILGGKLVCNISRHTTINRVTTYNDCCICMNYKGMQIATIEPHDGVYLHFRYESNVGGKLHLNTIKKLIRNWLGVKIYSREDRWIALYKIFGGVNKKIFSGTCYLGLVEQLTDEDIEKYNKSITPKFLEDETDGELYDKLRVIQPRIQPERQGDSKTAGGEAGLQVPVMDESTRRFIETCRLWVSDAFAGTEAQQS